MGMTDHEIIQSLLAAYALDAVDVDEALEIEAHLDGCPDCTAALAELRETVDRLADLAATTPAAEAERDHRVRTVAAALARRAARPTSFSPADLHLIESSRLVALLGLLHADQWATPVGAALPDWSVQDLAAHLAATEALLAEQLGVAPFTPEVADQPTARAQPAVERHRTLRPADTLAELETAYARVQQAVADLAPDADTRAVSWFGLDLTLAPVLTQRAFEIWTHADDIRAALDLPLLAPPAPSLQAMSATAVETLPILLAATGVEAEGRRARLTLVGPGGGTYEVDLGLEGRPVAAEPDVTLELDVVDFCRGLADRLPAERTAYRARGDADLAVAIVASLPALAVL